MILPKLFCIRFLVWKDPILQNFHSFTQPVIVQIVNSETVIYNKLYNIVFFLCNVVRLILNVKNGIRLILQIFLNNEICH